MVDTDHPRADVRRNTQRLLAAAADAFAEHGTDASLEDIAKRAGVGIGTLYRHFPTRRSLIEALLVGHLDALAIQASELADSPTPGEALDTWLRALIDHVKTYRGLTASVAVAMCSENKAAGRSLCGEMRTEGARLLARAQEAGAVRQNIEIDDLVSIVNAVAWAAEQGPDDPDRADRLLGMLLEGIWQHEPV